MRAREGLEGFVFQRGNAASNRATVVHGANKPVVEQLVSATDWLVKNKLKPATSGRDTSRLDAGAKADSGDVNAPDNVGARPRPATGRAPAGVRLSTR